MGTCEQETLEQRAHTCSILTLVTLSLYSIHTNVLLIRTLCVVMLCILTLCAIFNLSIFVYINAVFVSYPERER